MTISSSQKIYDFVEMKSSFFCFQRLDFQSRILFGLGCLILYSLCKLLKDYQNKPSRSHRANILLSLSNLNAAKTSKTPISTIPPIPPPIRLQICYKEMGKNEHTDIKITRIGEKVYEDVDRESLLKLHKQKFQLT